VEIKFPGTRGRSNRVKGNDFYTRFAGFFDHSVVARLRGSIYDDGINAFEDQAGQLAVLFRDAAIAVEDYVIGDTPFLLGSLCCRFESFNHLLTPGVAIVGIGKRDNRLVFGSKGRGRYYASGHKERDCAAPKYKTIDFHE